MKYKKQIAKIKNYTGGKETGAANALGDFAELLGMLAEDADKNSEISITLSKENLSVQKDVRDLTKALRTYTRWLIALTFALLVLGFLQLYSSVQVSQIASKATLKSDQPNEGKNKNDNGDRTQSNHDGINAKTKE